MVKRGRKPLDDSGCPSRVVRTRLTCIQAEWLEGQGISPARSLRQLVDEAMSAADAGRADQVELVDEVTELPSKRQGDRSGDGDHL